MAGAGWKLRSLGLAKELKMSDVEQPGPDASDNAFDVAAWVAKARQLPDVREDLVNRVKTEIAAGIYETPERLEAAVQRLMAEPL